MPKVPITQDKIKARKRKKRLLIFLGAIVCLAIIVFGLSSISSLSIFEIKNIEISGASDVDNLAVQTLAKQSLVGKTWGLFPHSDIFFVSAKRLADNIVHAFPSMANVSVKKNFFQHAYYFRRIQRAVRALVSLFHMRFHRFIGHGISNGIAVCHIECACLYEWVIAEHRPIAG